MLFAHFRVNGYNFNAVYDKVLGYQKGTTTAFNAYYSKKHGIDDLIKNSQAVKKGAAPKKAMVNKDVKSKVAAKKWL